MVKYTVEQFFKLVNFNPDNYYAPMCHYIGCNSCPFVKPCQVSQTCSEDINELIMREYKKYQSERMKLWQSLKN